MTDKTIEIGISVEDKNGRTLGKVSNIVMDGWTGKPRKYVLRLADDVSAVYFVPGNIAEVTEKKVRLNVAADEMERT
jgi:sporulation protein YlmC with PRC-barrel domain